MGVESYLVRLRGEHRKASRVAEYARVSFGITSDFEQSPLSSAYSHFVFRDGTHVIEYEFFQDGSGYEVSLRFALCHPVSVDGVFLAQAANLMTQFDLVATICEELPAGVRVVYSANELDEFVAKCAWSITRSRGYWRKMFGTEVAGVSVAGALGRFVYNSR